MCVIDRFLRFDPGDGEAVDEFAAGGGDERDEEREGGDPAAEDTFAMADGEERPALQEA